MTSTPERSGSIERAFLRSMTGHRPAAPDAEMSAVLDIDTNVIADEPQTSTSANKVSPSHT